MSNVAVDLMTLVESQRRPVEIRLINPKFDDTEKKAYLASFSSSSYESHTWVVDRISTDQNLTICRRKISFEEMSGLPDIEEQSKQWALSMLLQGYSFQTVRTKIQEVEKFIFSGSRQITSFNDITEDTVSSYKDLLFGEESSLSEKRAIRCWHTAIEWLSWCGCREICRLMKRTVVPKESKPLKRSDRYISSFVLRQLDAAFMEDVIPLAYRIVYWVLRLYPTRIGEVASMKTDCLKQYSEDSYTLSIATFKQAGTSDKGQPRMIRIRNEGFGAYLISLLQRQVDRIGNEATGTDFLLYEYDGRFDLKAKKFVLFKERKLKLVNRETFNNCLSSIVDLFEIIDENGDPAHVTTHMFRHNNITDRLESGLFRPIDLASLTGHHNTRMITDNYNHPNHEKESQTLQDNADGYKPVLFQGKVIGGNSERNYQRILKRKMAFEIDGIGICSDYRECGKDVYSCLSCPDLVVEADQIDRYRQEKREWEDKLDMAGRLGQENLVSKCENNIKHLQDIIARIEEAVKACEERKEQ